VLDKGEVLTCCPPSELAANPRVVEAYLGSRKQGRRPAVGVPRPKRDAGKVTS
jgi:hypothetical protein